MKRGAAGVRRLAAIAGGSLLALAVLYLAGVNLLLSKGGLARLLSARPDKLKIEYARARTFWPGRVHVEGLVVRGRDAKLEWELRIDEADAEIALFALLGRRFHVEKVAARGVGFRLRFRLEAAEATPDRIARLPPIAGFGEAPLRDPAEEAREQAEPAKEGFAVALENVRAEAVREVWLDSFRLTGDMASAGGFQLGPAHRIEVTPSSLAVREARLTIADNPILTGIQGAVNAVLVPVDLSEIKGVAVLRSLTTRSAFQAKVGGLHFLRHFIDPARVTLDGGAGTFRGSLVVERGAVKRGSSSHVELGPATLDAGDARLTASSVLDLAVADDDGGDRAELRVGLSAFAFSEPASASPAVTSPSLVLAARAAETNLAEPPRDVTYSLESPRVDLLDSRWLAGHLPKDGPFFIDDGHGTMSVRARGSTKELTVDMELASALSLRLYGARAATKLDARIHAHSIFDKEAIELSGTRLEMTGLAVGASRARGGWRGDVALDEAQLAFVPPSFTATATTSARDAGPLLSLYAAMRDTSPAVTTALALVPDPVVETMTANLHGGLRLAVSSGAATVHALDIQGAQTRVRGELVKRGDGTRGGLLFVAGPASAGVAFEGKTTRVVLVDAPGWFETSLAHPRAR